MRNNKNKYKVRTGSAYRKSVPTANATVFARHTGNFLEVNRIRRKPSTFITTAFRMRAVRSKFVQTTGYVTRKLFVFFFVDSRTMKRRLDADDVITTSCMAGAAYAIE